MSDILTNKNKTQVVSLHLDKTKLRELRFREFLDQNNKDGINRKESILRMFEDLYKDNVLHNGFSKQTESATINEDERDLDELSVNSLNMKTTEWLNEDE